MHTHITVSLISVLLFIFMHLPKYHLSRMYYLIYIALIIIYLYVTSASYFLRCWAQNVNFYMVHVLLYRKRLCIFSIYVTNIQRTKLAYNKTSLFSYLSCLVQKYIALKFIFCFVTSFVSE